MLRILIQSPVTLTKNNSLLYLNIGLVFISTSAVLGRYITVNSTVATWWRCPIAAIAIFLFCRIIKIPISIDSRRNQYLTWLSGCLLGVHWVSYFYSLDYSNAAIALLTLYTFPAMSAVLEPLFGEEKYELNNILLAIISLVGVAIINPSFDIQNNYTVAVILGLLSAFTYAVRNIVIKVPAKTNHGSALMFHQVIIVGVILSPSLILLDSSGWQDQLGALVTLALLTTAIGHSLLVMSLKSLSATTAGLLSCIVPVYALFWAYLFLGEIPTIRTMIGGIIIMSTVVIKTILDTREHKVL